MFGSMGGEYGPLGRRHSGKGRAVPVRRPSIVLRLVAFSGFLLVSSPADSVPSWSLVTVHRHERAPASPRACYDFAALLLFAVTIPLIVARLTLPAFGHGSPSSLCFRFASGKLEPMLAGYRAAVRI